MTGIDGRVNNLNRDVFSALQNVANPARLTEQDAKNIRSAIMKDGGIDAAERDLLNELTSNTSNIQINAQSSSSFSPSALNFQPAQGEAQSTLNTIKQPINLDRLWSNGSEGLTEMIELSSISPATRQAVTQFVAGKFLQSWNSSSVTNGYAPLRETLSNAYSAIQNSDPETNTNGRWLYYNAMKMVDNRAGDRIPDMLYNWIRPGGYL
ncbi:MAG: hypothetical protein IGS03_08560 [Candidatus Sericytochromatia bacterium]|nr:hypothetical protein [Candidatus Sericytochromatia bacterium]